MTSEVEGVGEAVTGGLIARAVEPAAGEALESGTRCLNCGTDLIGPYCHHCGQAGHVHRSLAGFGHDIAHSVLHFEGKIWRTLPLLAWRPGELTRRYVHGERARFVSPIALFLFSVFLMFAVFSAVGGSLDFAGDGAQRPDDGRTIADGRTAAGRNVRLSVEPTGIARIDAAVAKAQANPELLLYKLQSNAYKFSWALIPISVPLLWLLFPFRRRHKLYDHLVFVTYSIAFMTLFLVAVTLLGEIGMPSGAIAAAVLVVPPVHIYRQLKQAYELSRIGALWRTLLLIAFALVAIGLFLLLLVAIGMVV
jgi:hypothetical protein